MTASPLPLERPIGEPPASEPSLGEEREDRRRRRKAILLLLLLGILMFLIGLTIWYLLFRQPIKPPIPLIPDANLPSYSTSLYDVKRPVGVAVNAAGDRIFVAQDSPPYAVVMLDGSGTRIGTLQPPADGGDHVPVYLAIDPLTNEVYVTDRPAGAIYIYDENGRYQRTYEPAVPITAWQPLGIAFDAKGDLYVTDLGTAKQRVEEFDRQGKQVRTFGEDAGLSFPNGVGVDANGFVYIADSDNGRLLVFDTAGKQVGQIGRGVGEGNLGLPRGVAITADRVFVPDVTGQGVFAYRPQAPGEARPTFVGFFGGAGIADGQFQFPNGGIAVDGRGRVYVADTVNDRIQVWSN